MDARPVRAQTLDNNGRREASACRSQLIKSLACIRVGYRLLISHISDTLIQILVALYYHPESFDNPFSTLLSLHLL